MRVCIELHSDRPQLLTWDYRYPIAGWLYRTIGRIAPEYATFLHQSGYPLDQHRRTRLFTFALRVENARGTSQGLMLDRRSRVHLLISSPIHNHFVRAVLEAILAEPVVEIVFPPHRLRWQIEQVRAVPRPVFGEQVVARLLSPLVVSVPGQRHPQYLRALDERVPELLRINALKKYRLVAAAAPRGTIALTVDRAYVERSGGDRSRRISSLHRIKVGTPAEIAIRAFTAPIHISGDPDIIAVLYDCGIGEKNSMGFGCWEPLDADQSCP